VILCRAIDFAEDEVGEIQNVENRWSSRSLPVFQRVVIFLSSGSIGSTDQASRGKLVLIQAEEGA
jgi:hypothetical protein